MTDYYPSVPEDALHVGVLPLSTLGTVTFQREFPASRRVALGRSGINCSLAPEALVSYRPNRQRPGLDIRRRTESSWDFFTSSSIPVVTFLAPLASNFEGLKDR